MNNNKFLEINIPEVDIFQRLFENLRQYYADTCNVVFKKNGLTKILYLSDCRSYSIKICLDSIRINFFNSKKKTIRIGICVNTFADALNNFNHEPLSIFMIENNHNILYLEQNKLIIEYGLFDVLHPNLSIGEIKFDSTTQIKSSEFFDVGNFFNQFNWVQVQTNCFGELICSSNDYKNRHIKNNLGIFYESRNLLIMANIASINDVTELYLKKDFPLVSMTKIGTMGKLLVLISPLIMSTYNDQPQIVKNILPYRPKSITNFGTLSLFELSFRKLFENSCPYEINKTIHEIFCDIPMCVLQNKYIFRPELPYLNNIKLLSPIKFF